MPFKRAGLYPADLDLCQRVFDQICSDEHIARSSLEADHLALDILVALEEEADADEAELLELIRSKRRANRHLRNPAERHDGRLRRR
ncbi:hypothetical protein [Mesorhizobium escarrei]|uniref:DUF982 domain-containing protein n=1 Tax=Mesorhizobium escarrei TaxID=666018 RepID=A0ABN8JLD2_9HYPH|nr:hypothetical protein [Mesorhizobium escarrei]CAH2398197.1 conserved hypothetical protein [Mesorhizobium escarrei]